MSREQTRRECETLVAGLNIPEPFDLESLCQHLGAQRQRPIVLMPTAMAFGNLDDRSGTGVIFSRHPTGACSGHYGEWLPKGQGEDIVSGSCDPLPLEAMTAAVPAAYTELLDVAKRLDDHAGYAQDIEFTVESGKLWFLQSRKAKVAVGSPENGVVPRPAGASPIARGRSACPGVVTGRIVIDVEEAEARALAGEDVILARPTTNPHDVHAMAVVKGILTEVGGTTSHAAVVSRELGVPCVVGCGEGVLTPHNGKVVTLDASTGEVFEAAERGDKAES